MIPLKECRTLLGPVGISESEVEEVREQLYRLAEIFVDAWINESTSKPEGQQETVGGKRDGPET